MRFLRSTTSRTSLVILSFMITALAVSLSTRASVNAHPGAPIHRASTSNCIGVGQGLCWYIQTVDFGTNTNNYVTGINDSSAIVGAYGSSNAYHSFWATPHPNPTGYTTFTPENYSNYNTFLEGLDNGGQLSNVRMAGYAVRPFCDSQCTPLGVVDDKGMWKTIQDPSQGSGPCAVTEVLAINDASMGVGYYLNTSCKPQAFEFYPDANGDGNFTYVDFSPSPPPGQGYLSSTANGITVQGDVVGTVTYGSTAQPQTAAWYYSELKYYWFQIKATSSYNTSGNGINFNDRVVGDYVDSLGTHGFEVQNPKNANHYPTYTTIDYPPNSSHSYTVLNSIERDGYITGWYQQGGYYHGLVGFCKKTSTTNTCPSVPAPSSRTRRHLKGA